MSLVLIRNNNNNNDNNNSNSNSNNKNEDFLELFEILEISSFYQKILVWKIIFILHSIYFSFVLWKTRRNRW